MIEEIKGLRDLIGTLINIVDNEGHTFDANSEHCKECKMFNICNKTNNVAELIKEADMSDEDKDNCITHLSIIKQTLGQAIKDSEEEESKVEPNYDNMTKEQLIELLKNK